MLKEIKLDLSALPQHSNKKITSLECYYVGGVVRDTLLCQLDKNIVPKETDWVVVGSNPAQLQQLGFKQVGKDFPVFLHPQTKQEFALARLERKQGHGYTGFNFEFNERITLEQDLQRRDLTINAMAVDSQGKLHDPYAGFLDLNQRLLRHVSDAFIEDPLRVFRVARFYAHFAYLGFRITPETKSLMGNIVHSGEINHLNGERIWQETQKAFNTRSPQLFFKCLHQIGALKYWFPEIEALFGVPQTARWHPEIDTGIHTLMVLAEANKLKHHAENPTAMLFSALTHDLGKGTTSQNILPAHHGHEKAGVPLVRKLAKRLKIPKKVLEMATLTAEWHTHLHDYKPMRAETHLKVLNKIDALRRPERFKDILIVAEADARGRLGFQYQADKSQKKWHQLLNAITAVKIDKLSKNPQEISNQLQEERLQAITQTLLPPSGLKA